MEDSATVVVEASSADSAVDSGMEAVEVDLEALEGEEGGDNIRIRHCIWVRRIPQGRIGLRSTRTRVY